MGYSSRYSVAHHGLASEARPTSSGRVENGVPRRRDFRRVQLVRLVKFVYSLTDFGLLLKKGSSNIGAVFLL
jgi:hypothetical protein